MSQTLAFHLDSNTSSAALPFLSFNPSLGTLQSVLVSFNNVTLSQDWWLWNGGGAAMAVSYAASLTGASLTVGDVDNTSVISFAALNYSGVTPTLNAVSLLTYAAESNALIGGTLPPTADAFQSADATSAAGTVLPPIDFPGGLTLAFDPGVWTTANTGNWNVTGNNIYTTSLVAVDGSATVTYDYAVPDAGPGFLAGGVWILLGIMAQWRRGRGRSLA